MAKKEYKIVQKGRSVVTQAQITELFVVPGTTPGRPALQVVVSVPEWGGLISYLHTTGNALPVTQRILKALGCTSLKKADLEAQLIGKTVTVRIAEQVRIEDDGEEVSIAPDVSIRTSDEAAEEALEALGLG